ncbi:MAG TPA: hypothetical protein VI338_02295 [Nitrososphaera sp.]|jgi:hypothetical protein|nr:hypothetical protein [Nitrososphaera sp.]
MAKPFQTRPAGTGTSKSPGFCIVCSAAATTEALFKVEDAIVIQRFCDKHLAGANYTMAKN